MPFGGGGAVRGCHSEVSGTWIRGGGDVLFDAADCPAPGTGATRVDSNDASRAYPARGDANAQTEEQEFQELKAP